MKKLVTELITPESVAWSRQSNGHLNGLFSALVRDQVICPGKLSHMTVTYEIEVADEKEKEHAA